MADVYLDDVLQGESKVTVEGITAENDKSEVTPTNHRITEEDLPVGTDVEDTAHTFTKPQRTSIVTGSNAIDFDTQNNITLAATAADITKGNVVNCNGQSGIILISSYENVTGWGADFIFGDSGEPTGMTGEQLFSYFVKDSTHIHIGWRA